MTGKTNFAFKAQTRRVSFWAFARQSAQALVEGFRRYRKYRRDYRELQKLPDYLLRDIGLQRADVQRAQDAHQLDFYWAPWQ